MSNKTKPFSCPLMCGATVKENQLYKHLKDCKKKVKLISL